jgi:hypothetical protein
LNLIDLAPVEATALLQSHRIQPEFSFVILAFHMDMWRFMPIGGAKEQSIRSIPKYAKHKSEYKQIPFLANSYMGRGRG